MKRSKKSKPIKRRRIKFTSCDICLIVYGSVLLHAERQDLVAQHDESLLRLTPTELAAAARRLLPNTTRQQRIALGLPNDEFVGTALQLPPITSQNLKNAVSLQLPTLLPGITEPLLLAVQPALTPNDSTIALWMSAKRAEELFQAFSDVGLFLAVILPRTLVALPAVSSPIQQIYDEDETTITCLEWAGTTLRHWLHLPKADLELPEFRQQLDHFLTTLSRSDIQQINQTAVADWENLPMPPNFVYAYSFIPPGAVLRAVQVAKRRKRRYVYVLAGLVVLALIGGLVTAHLYKQKLEMQLAAVLSGLEESSQLPNKVQQIEDEVAPISQFPRQDIIEVLSKLDTLIPKDSWLTGFNIEAGKVEIEGYSPNAAKLLEVLANEKNFEEVGFSRATRSDPGRREENFGIRFKLKGIDVPAYWLHYFPTADR